MLPDISDCQYVHYKQLFLTDCVELKFLNVENKYYPVFTVNFNFSSKVFNIFWKSLYEYDMEIFYKYLPKLKHS